MHSDIRWQAIMQEKVAGDFLWGGTIPSRRCNDKLSNPQGDKGAEWPCLQRSSAVKTKIFHPLFLSPLTGTQLLSGEKCITVVFGVGLCYNVSLCYDFSAYCYAVSACYGVNLCYGVSTCFSVSLRVMC